MYVSPIYKVKRIPLEKIKANSYNPNHVSPHEMELLYKSILEDGYTQPIVCYYLQDEDKYEIVDGYHRYSIMKKYKNIRTRERSTLPVVVIDKDISNRMASTVRHNRARGTHNVDLMVNMVRTLIEDGKDDKWLKTHVGIGKEELMRFKQISGLSKLFADKDFSKSWEYVKENKNE